MNPNPKVILSSVDYDRLQALMDAQPDSFPGKATLQAELDRADVVDPAKLPPDVVTMNSTVRFQLEPGGGTFDLRLVYPRDAAGGSDRVSVLAPVGSALLGLSVGDRIDWPGPGGTRLAVRIVEVLDQPEREGRDHGAE